MEEKKVFQQNERLSTPEVYRDAGELIFSVFILLISTIAFIMSFSFSSRARMLPQAVTLLMIILSAVQVWQFRHCAGAVVKADWKAWFVINRKLMFTILCFLLYPLALKLIGFIVSSILLMGALMYIRGLRNYKIMIPIGLITPIVVYILFDVVARVQLPAGPWGF